LEKQANSLKVNLEQNTSTLNELTEKKAKHAKELRELEEVLRSKRDEQKRIRETNENLTKGITARLKERNTLRSDIAKYSKGDVKKAEEINKQLKSIVKTNETQISRLENNLIITKQHLVEAMNTLNELGSNGLYECDLSFKEYSRSFHTNL
jgi:chromosome segregation ATPase